jgi:hypothetical protein
VQLRDPRVQKTVQVMMLVLFGIWLGELDARATFSTRHWVMLLAILVGIAWGVIAAGAAGVGIGDDVTQVAAARLLGINDQTSRRWAQYGAHGTSEILIRLLLTGRIKPADIYYARRYR